MRSLWKEVAVLQERMSETLARALETASRVNGYVDEYARVRNDDREAARALAYSASKTFAVALFVVGVVFACGLVSFQLIVLPLGGLMPKATLLGASLAKLSAGVLVLVQVALGVFVMDGVGITELLPRLAALPGPRRRRLLAVALAGLFGLAVIEGLLAGMGEGHGLAEQLLGFVLPWLCALAVVPLGTLLDSGRHVGVALAAWLVSGAGSLAFLLAHGARASSHVLPSVIDVYVSVPLRIERWLARPRAAGVTRPHAGSPA
jgi:hypothetical protein